MSIIFGQKILCTVFIVCLSFHIDRICIPHSVHIALCIHCITSHIGIHAFTCIQCHRRLYDLTRGHIMFTKISSTFPCSLVPLMGIIIEKIPQNSGIPQISSFFQLQINYLRYIYKSIQLLSFTLRWILRIFCGLVRTAADH